MKVRVFLETGSKDSSEKLFFENLLMQLNIGLVDTNSFVNCNGWPNLKNQEATLSLADENTRNVVIFDADHSFEERKREIEVIKAELTAKKNKSNKREIDFDLFLMPNNKDEGCFETLLEACFLPKYRCLFECFEKFETCVESKGYPKPNQKDKVYSCVDIAERKLGLKLKDKNKFWQFDNSDLWDINCEELKPLIEFLSKYKTL